MNIIQKAIDASLLALAVIIVIAGIAGLAPKPTAHAAERFTYAPGILGNDVGPGPKWEDLKGMTTNLR